MPSEFPDIVRYAEYRHFLRDLYLAMKAREKRFSHRLINAKCQARSSGWFADIVAGRQRLKPVHLRGLAAVFKLDPRTQGFLAALVDLERAEDPASRARAMERWLSLKGVRHEWVARDRFAFFDHWYHLALREVLSLVPFDGDYEALGARLRPPISGAEAKQAVELLERLQLIMPKPWYRRLADLPVLVKLPDGEARHWRNILTDLMRLAPRALAEYGKHERDFSALTFSLSPDGLAKAGEAIAELRRKLLLIAEKDQGQNRVYQALFQVFPVTGVLEAGHA